MLIAEADTLQAGVPWEARRRLHRFLLDSKADVSILTPPPPLVTEEACPALRFTSFALGISLAALALLLAVSWLMYR